MLDPALTLYIFISAYAVGLLSPYLTSEQGQVVATTSPHRPVAPLHDVGKVGIPDHILLKPGRLDPAEWEIMKTHTLIGEEVLKAAAPKPLSEGASPRTLALAIEIAGGHHERWDGQGYPRGLSGESIPKSARLMTVADIYDALTSARPYKKTWSHAKAVDEITHLSGTKLDPMVVAAFLEEQDRFREIARRFKDA